MGWRPGYPTSITTSLSTSNASPPHIKSAGDLENGYTGGYAAIFYPRKSSEEERGILPPQLWTIGSANPMTARWKIHYLIPNLEFTAICVRKRSTSWSRITAPDGATIT